MMYDLGDRVRIIASGKTGSICDARMVDGRPLYIVDCSGECDSDALKDCVVTAEENEIEWRHRRMEKDKVKGWVATDYAFEELYDAYLSILFEYQGKEYRLSCEGDKALYDCDTGEILWTFTDKESFYNGIIFGRPIQDVINDSYLICLM